MILDRFVLVLLLLSLAACAASPPQEQPAEPPAAAEATPRQSADTISGESTEDTDEDVMFRVLSAEMRGNEGDLEGAVGDYLAAAMNSEDPQISMRATRIAFAAQAWQQASMAADRWAYLAPDNIPAHESAALAMLATADYAGAELHLQRILELAPDKAAAWSMVSGLLGRSASPEKASKVLATLLESAGEEGSAAGVHAQSQVAVRLGDLSAAYEFAREAARLDPRPEYLAWAGRLANNQGDREGALVYTRQAWEADPENHDLTLAYADMLARSGDEAGARQLLAQMPQTPDVMLTRILFEQTAGQPETAAQLYQEFQQAPFEPGDERFFFLAQAAEALGYQQEAIEYFDQVGQGDFYAAAMSRMAELRAELGDLDGARASLQALRGHPNRAVVEQSWLSEAQILQQAGELDEAIRVLERALQGIPGSIPLLYAEALIAAQLGEVEQAETALVKILREEPDNAAALNALGYTLADLTDRLSEAEEYIRRAYALQPDDAAITDSMGWVAFRQGRLGEAEKYLRQAWNMDNNPEIAAHLGEVLWELGRQEDARQIWQQGLAVDSGNEVLLRTLQRLDPSLLPAIP